MLLSFMIWSTAQGFGGPYGAGSTDVGVSIIYILVFTGIFLGNAGLTFGVDRYLASKLGRWNLLASGPVEQPREERMRYYPIPGGYPQILVQHPVTPHPLEPVLHGTAASRSRLEAVKGQRLSRL